MNTWPGPENSWEGVDAFEVYKKLLAPINSINR